jgi:hypothetical protein
MMILEGEQYSLDWWAARRGKPSASEAGCILTPKTLKLAAAADGYINRLIGDTFDHYYPRPDDRLSQAQRRGLEQEEESRRWYSFDTGLDVVQVCLCISDCGRFVCSPDGLVGPQTDEGMTKFEGGLELKNPSPHTHVAWLRAGTLPDEHRAQVHFQLLVTGLPWVDFCSYARGLPPFLVRVTPDEYTAALKEALETFWTRYDEARAKIAALILEGAVI